MKVLWYLAVPIMLVTVYCVVMWWRNRQPTSLESGVDTFRREMEALSPPPMPERRRAVRPSVTSPVPPHHLPGGADSWPVTSPSTSARRTRSCTPAGRGIVLNEPSVIALNQQTGDVLAMGHRPGR